MMAFMNSPSLPASFSHPARPLPRRPLLPPPRCHPRPSTSPSTPPPWRRPCNWKSVGWNFHPETCRIFRLKCRRCPSKMGDLEQKCPKMLQIPLKKTRPAAIMTYFATGRCRALKPFIKKTSGSRLGSIGPCTAAGWLSGMSRNPARRRGPQAHRSQPLPPPREAPLPPPCRPLLPPAHRSQPLPPPREAPLPLRASYCESNQSILPSPSEVSA